MLSRRRSANSSSLSDRRCGQVQRERLDIPVVVGSTNKGVRAREDVLGATPEDRKLAFDLPRQPTVVGVQECEVLGPGTLYRYVSDGCGLTLSLDMHVCDISPGLDKFRRAVARVVVDNDHLDVTNRLSRDAVESRPEQVRAVVSRNDGRQQWHRRLPPAV